MRIPAVGQTGSVSQENCGNLAVLRVKSVFFSFLYTATFPSRGGHVPCSYDNLRADGLHQTNKKIVN
jgi:hypothetical protein